MEKRERGNNISFPVVLRLLGRISSGEADEKFGEGDQNFMTMGWGRKILEGTINTSTLSGCFCFPASLLEALVSLLQDQRRVCSMLDMFQDELDRLAGGELERLEGEVDRLDGDVDILVVLVPELAELCLCGQKPNRNPCCFFGSSRTRRSPLVVSTSHSAKSP